MYIVKWSHTGKMGSGNATHTVSLVQKNVDTLEDVNIPGLCPGVGSCYGDALEDFLENFDAALKELHSVREMLNQPYGSYEICERKNT